MARGLFLVNPELNADDIDVVASSELGRRVGEPTPFETNAGLMTMSAIGDPGDTNYHDVWVKGSQQRPAYFAVDPASSTALGTLPDTFATLGATIPITNSTAKVAVCVAYDRLYGIVADGADLTVYVWTGSAWTAKATYTGLTDHSGGIAACHNGGTDWVGTQTLYIAVANNTNSVVELYRFDAAANTLGIVYEVAFGTDGTAYGIAMESNGAIFTFLVTTTASGNDVKVWSGPLGTLRQRTASINDTFSSLWTTGGDVRAPGLTWNAYYGFIAAFRCGTGSPASLRVATSIDGDAWQELKGIDGTVSQPAVTTPWSNAMNCVVTAERTRIFVVRATAAAQNSAPDGVKLQWFNGYGSTDWRSETDAKGSVAITSATQLGAASWRGTMYFGWRSSGTVSTVRKCNDLSTSAIYLREIRFNQNMFVAGLDDDSRTALYFIARGQVTAGDKWRIPAANYNYRVEYVLDDFMSKVWRGDQDAEQTIQLDAGSGRAFAFDAIALVGLNLPSLTVETSDDVAFGTTVTSQAISGTVQSATIVSVDRNRIVFASGTFRDRRYAAGGPVKYWVQYGSTVLRVLDNTNDSLIVDGNATGASGAATIFGDSMGYVFASVQTPARYLRLVTPTLVVPDGYYEIARVIFGLRLSLPRNFSSGFVRDHSEIETETLLKSGARFPTKLNNRQRVAFKLPWQVVQLDPHLRAIQGLYALSQGRRQLVAFWPFPGALGGSDDSGNQPDVYMGRFVQSLGVTHQNKDFYGIDGAQFETEV